MMWLSNADEIVSKTGNAAEQIQDALTRAAETKKNDPLLEKMRAATASINADASGTWNRAQEVIEFAKRMGYTKIGLAFCAGLKEEARVMAEALTSHGLEVSAVACSIEGPCNSVGQAMILNELGTELNIMMGLCIGHDATFIRFSEAPVTPLAVKDKVTCHNPVAALVCGYQKKRLF